MEKQQTNNQKMDIAIKRKIREIFITKTQIQIDFTDKEDFHRFNRTLGKTKRLVSTYLCGNSFSETYFLKVFIAVERQGFYETLYRHERDLSLLIQMLIHQNTSRDFRDKLINIRDNFRTLMRNLGYKGCF